MKRIVGSLGVVVALASGALGVRSLADDGVRAQAPVTAKAQAANDCASCERESRAECAPSRERARDGKEACGPGGCSPPATTEARETRCCAPAWDTAGPAAGEAANEGFDPVCRQMVDMESAAATRQANGLTFYFCSEEHARTFDADRLAHLYCPVFKGSRVNPSVSAEKDGETYYFCCAACKLRFLQGGASGAFLGVRLALDADTHEIRIDGVIPNSPAARAEIEAGMVVLAVDGRRVNGPERFLRLMGSLKPDRETELELRTACGEERTLRVRLGRRPR